LEDDVSQRADLTCAHLDAGLPVILEAGCLDLEGLPTR
jgi:hypothetical protein